MLDFCEKKFPTKNLAFFVIEMLLRHIGQVISLFTCFNFHMFILFFQTCFQFLFHVNHCQVFVYVLLRYTKFYAIKVTQMPLSFAVHVQTYIVRHINYSIYKYVCSLLINQFLLNMILSIYYTFRESKINIFFTPVLDLFLILGITIKIDAIIFK